MATLATQLGASYRLYVAKVDDPANDAAANWELAVNEAGLNYSATVRTTDHETKENGGEIVTLGGPIQYNLSAQGAHIYTDAAQALLLGAVGQSIELQVRYDDAGTEKVKIEGNFLVSEFSQEMNTSGAATFNFTFVGAGNVTFNGTPRALVLT